MGEIVGAAVVCHQPGIMAPKPVREIMGGGVDTSMIEGFARLREAIDAVGGDTVVIFDTHWFTTVEHIVAGQERFAGIYTSEELPNLIKDLEYDFPGAPELAAMTETVGRERGVPVLNCTNQHLHLHYPTLNLVHYLGSDLKVMPVGVCQSAEAHNFIDFGAVVAEAIQRTAGRVVLLGSGGMSHTFWPLDVLRQHAAYQPHHVRTAEARAMDERILELWKAGDHAAVTALYPEYRQHNPEGFFGHYLMMLGALGGPDSRVSGRQMSDYENAVGTGQVHVWFDVVEPAPARSTAAA
jgi:3,4-dihydroxyphenylacetate 2,3-dioxygenase